MTSFTNKPTKIFLLLGLLHLSPYAHTTELPRLSPDEAIQVLANTPLQTTEVDQSLALLRPQLADPASSNHTPNPQQLQDSLITLLNYLDDYASANPAALTRAEYISRTAESYVLASHLGVADAPQKANQLLQTWTELEPQSNTAFFMAGKHWMKHPETYKKAQLALQQAQALGHPHAGYFLAILWIGQNQPQKGIQQLRQHLQQHPQDAQAQELLNELLWTPKNAPKKGAIK